MAVDTSYLVPMIIVLLILVGALGFALYYYFAQLKPRLDTMVFDKKTGVIGFKDSTGALLLLKPPPASSTDESSHVAVQNIPSKSAYDFELFTKPIAGNTKGQVQINFLSSQGSGFSLPLTK